MKKIVTLMLIALGLSPVTMAQSYDDLYYNPNKKDTSLRKEEKKQVTEKKRTYVSTDMPVVVKDRKGNIRDVDEYNRRYDAKENSFEVIDDTLYVEEKDYPERGEWVNGFDGSKDDYEYAQRIIRFRNPRYAVSISSPYYWDIVYGLNSWDWNVYVDDFYAYAFPTFTNRLWWDWRYNSFGWGWGSSWGYPSWGGYYGSYYSGYYGGYWGGHWGYPNYGWDGPWYGGGYGGGYGGHGLAHNGYYNNRRSDFGDSRVRPSSSNRRTSAYSRAGYGEQDRTSTYVNRRSASGRVVGTRIDRTDRSDVGTGVSRRSGYIRSESNYSGRTDGSSRRSSYARPSSTRTYSTGSEGVERRGSSYSRPSSTTRSGSYNRGSSTTTTRSYYDGNSSSSRSYNNSNSSSTRSYSPSSSGSSSRSSSGGSSGGGSSRSGGGSSSGSSRSGGGGGGRR